MQEVRKLAKNAQWFRTIVQKAPINYKSKKGNIEMDENNLAFNDFCNILDFIAEQAEIAAPTNEQKFQLFEQFNDGKNELRLVKEEWQKFTNRLFEMLSATISG